MEMETHARRLATLGHPGRLAVFRLLARRAPGGVQPSDIAASLGMKPSTLSAHLAALVDAGLARAERHGREIRYRIDLRTAGALVDFLAADCCRGRPDLCAPRTIAALTGLKEPLAMTDKTWNVLFICTGNSARSIFAEALLRDLGEGRFNAFSAGMHPATGLNPTALHVLEKNGHATDGLHAKGTEAFEGESAPRMDFVFTVCDRAANVECAVWPAAAITGHWGVPDPVKAEGTEAEKGFAFAQAYGQLRRRISAFVNLPFESLDRIALQHRVDDLGTEATAEDARQRPSPSRRGHG